MGALVLERYRRFVDSLPVAERDLPYLSFRGRFYSPNEILYELEADTSIGKELQRIEDELIRRYG